MGSQQRVEGIPNDQPPIIYAYSRDGDASIREIIRSGYRQRGVSPGDVPPRESARSNPKTPFLVFDVPGQRRLQQDAQAGLIPVRVVLEKHPGLP